MIRRAIPADLPFLLEMERQCPTAAHWDEKRYSELFRPNEVERLVLVADEGDAENGTIVRGFLVARCVAGEWELENIVIAPSTRRTGLGRRLLEDLLSRATELRDEFVFLEVRESNSAARGLYESAGFEQTGRRKGYYLNPLEDAILYRRSLTPFPMGS